MLTPALMLTPAIPTAAGNPVDLPPPPIVRELEHNHSGRNRVRELIDKLHGKISPVLSQQLPAPEVAGNKVTEAVAGDSIVTIGLREGARELHGLADDLMRIIERIEL